MLNFKYVPLCKAVSSHMATILLLWSMIFINHEHKENKNQQNTEWKWIYWPNCRKCVSFNIKQTRKQIRYMYNQQVYLYTLNETHLSALTLHWNNLSLYNHWARWVQYNTLQYIEYNNMYQKTIPTETSKSDMNLYQKISRV